MQIRDSDADAITNARMPGKTLDGEREPRHSRTTLTWSPASPPRRRPVAGRTVVVQHASRCDVAKGT